MSGATDTTTRPQRRVQRELWDCGLICAEMVLAHAGYVDEAGQLAAALLEGIIDGSVWTPDVAVRLASRGMRCTLHTTLPGVNSTYGALDFYARSFLRDEERVPRVFDEARSLGVEVVQGSVDASDVCAALEGGRTLFIALLDRRHQVCTVCEGHTNSLIYVGHYVLLYGFDRERDRILYLDPAPNVGDGCEMSTLDFDAARKSVGTDEDLIAVHL